MNTMKRYVHPSDAAFWKQRKRCGAGTKFGHNPENAKSEKNVRNSVKVKGLAGATRRD
jgi:hypothetical protein